MAKSDHPSRPLGNPHRPVASPLFLRDEEVRRGMELLFFGYHRLMAKINSILAENGLGHAHYRALYFIGRYPDINVGELLSLLDITKQSLNRITQDLLEKKLVIRTIGRNDRRARLLHLSEQGKTLEVEIFAILRVALVNAYGEAGQEKVAGYWQILQDILPMDDARLLHELAAKRDMIK